MSFSTAGTKIAVANGGGRPGGDLPGTYRDMTSLAGYVWKEVPYDDWVELNQGDRVRVRRPGGQVHSARVDDVAEDASYFWVWLDQARGRVLISKGDGSTVWR
ncbi:hypothetical protein ABIC98_003928 [Arthrobacter nitrophenolicus]|uniref:Uncharacterized protein n=1 Tax=Arthrobacter nitrophenolicus TaxID=683150 RepID=A0ACC6TKU5_9MICC